MSFSSKRPRCSGKDWLVLPNLISWYSLNILATLKMFGKERLRLPQNWLLRRSKSWRKNSKNALTNWSTFKRTWSNKILLKKTKSSKFWPTRLKLKMLSIRFRDEETVLHLNEYKLNKNLFINSCFFYFKFNLLYVSKYNNLFSKNTCILTKLKDTRF